MVSVGAMLNTMETPLQVSDNVKNTETPLQVSNNVENMESPLITTGASVDTCGEKVMASEETVFPSKEISVAVQSKGSSESSGPMGSVLLCTEKSIGSDNVLSVMNVFEGGVGSGSPNGDGLLVVGKGKVSQVIEVLPDGAVLENLDTNIEELAQTLSDVRVDGSLARRVVGSLGSVSNSEGVGVLPYIVKDKDGASDPEVLKPEVRTSMKLCSSKAPSRPARLDL
ncbi:hypothetical protein I3843_10G106500 [Carya illinoinensis]|nr:hypothetical protein I3843_10G106500 [Carya illinoinensis]